MQVVRLFYFIALFIASTYSLVCQELKGSYRNVENNDSFSQFTLSDSRFEFQVQGIEQYKGKGYYLSVGDTLILVHEADGDISKSRYTQFPLETCELGSDEETEFLFRVKNKDGELLKNAVIYVMGKNDPILSGATNKKGEFKVVTPRKPIFDIRIRISGYEMALILPYYYSLRGNCIGYNVTLEESPSRHFKTEVVIEKYLIQKNKREIKSLKALNSSRIWIKR